MRSFTLLLVVQLLIQFILYNDNTVVFSQQSSSRIIPIRNSTYIIGDLHGDVECARYWVEQTGLVIEVVTAVETTNNNNNSSSSGSKREWADPTSVLVFMGDYIDKGPTSRQTLEYVKGLTEEFPKNVIALLGNHEMELLLDAEDSSSSSTTRWNGYAYHNLIYASVHPLEYLNYLHPSDREEDDNLVIDALYDAALRIYGSADPQLYNSVFILPDSSTTNDSTGSSNPTTTTTTPSSIVHHIQPKSIRPLVTQRLKLYQQRYIEQFHHQAPLGIWLRSRPILHLTHDGTLLVHGGIPLQLARVMLSKGLVDIMDINRQWVQQQNNTNLYSFITETWIGQAIYTMVTYRGNHYYKSCSQYQQLFQSMEGVVRLGVGHTPQTTVRMRCHRTFLALDSALGRWIRASGNEYCRGNETYTYGNFICPKINPICQGQIVRINGDDQSVHILTNNDSKDYQQQQQQQQYRASTTTHAVDEL